MLLDPRLSPSLVSLSTHPSPPASPPPPPSQPSHSNLLDDIFSSSRSPSPQASRPTSASSPSPHHHHSNSNHPSDIPRLRTTHSTAGYREGLAAAKTAALQGGFDEGFTLGAVIGGRVGELAGVLEGVCRALGSEGRGGGRVKGGGKGREKGQGEGGEVTSGDRERDHEAIQRVLTLRQAAAAELSFQKIFASELWDADGVWKWDVPPLSGTATEGTRASTTAAEGDDGITFPVVAAAHPAIRKWTAIVDEVMREWGVKREAFEGEEWEAGRVGD